ncbi:MAG: hypothetical protein Q9163_004134 [Psora crenata]
MRSLEASQNAGPVALILTIGLINRSLLTRGVTLTRTFSNTDNIIMLLLFAIVTIWASLSGEWIRIPWIALVFAWFWLVTYGSSLLRGSSSPLWHMDCANGPFGWRVSLASYWLYFLYVLLVLLQVPSSLMLIYEGRIVEAVLSLAGLGLFLSSGLPRNKYITAKHQHGGDNLRIALPTSHIEGTVYVLPASGHGFEAVWSPKVQAEHVQTDAEIMGLFAQMHSGSYSLSEPLKRLRTTMSAFNETAELTSCQVNDLAEWLLMDPASTIARTSIKAQRPPNVHLIGRDTMFALAHAEYLVFMRKDSLEPRLRKQLGKLRESKRSGGLDNADATPTIGYKEGLAGYQEAVRYVYGLLDQPICATALEPPPMPSHYSVALGRSIDSTEDYIAALWTVCLEHSESTFSALYMFCCVWFIEVGNVGGFHIFPLRCESQEGDAVAWLIIWRQGWYEAMIAQFIASSPLMAMGFIAGLF